MRSLVAYWYHVAIGFEAPLIPETIECRHPRRPLPRQELGVVTFGPMRLLPVTALSAGQNSICTFIVMACIATILVLAVIRWNGVRSGRSHGGGLAHG